MSKIRVIFCMNQIIVGGIEKNLQTVLLQLASDSNYELSVISLKPALEYFSNFCMENDIKLFDQGLDRNSFISSKKPEKVLKGFFWRLRRTIIKKEISKKIYNILNKNDLIIDYFNCGFAGILNGLKINHPIIGWEHSNINVVKNAGYIKYLDQYTKYVCVSDSFCNDFKLLFPKHSDKVVRIYNAINKKNIIDLAKDAAFPSDGIPYFVSVARMHKDKDIETLLKGFSIFSKNKQVKLYLLGDGDKRNDFENLAQTLGLDGKAVFCGTVQNPFGYVKNSMASVLSSFGEGFGCVLIEAQALGVLTIASDCKSGVSEVLMDGNAGILFKLGDQNDLSKKMELVWNNQIDCDNLRTTATLGLDRFDVAKVKTNIDNLIRSTVSNNRYK